jgi:hypothetical protein
MKYNKYIVHSFLGVSLKVKEIFRPTDQIILIAHFAVILSQLKPVRNHSAEMRQSMRSD